ncbi:PTS sugar transporter subunit IIC [Anaerosacchariphilus sp. NSJ-68]|uniref:PTS sugar transporter subunit IIC n=2 Tax=Lachnospiraceae TaxID=186803 RepID=A0A923L9J2_9FIRM|nr:MULTISPECIES: PTS sugar transporter subunit IIC [Lachnospiraceae]MBC5658213.1 PTS sugar transporter subunit IIC [Anaerosacchariphilus hominis]MBC5698580.1 PTS sugar transporter subunit IIC [Roseburia difficilis]
MTLKLAIAAALLYGFCWTQLFYAPTCILWYSALIQGFILGLLAGDVTTGMILGGGITLLTISMVASGGVEPSDIAFAGSVTISIALINHMDTGTALTLAIAMGLIGEFYTPVCYTIANIFPHMVDKYAEEGNIEGIKRTTWLAAATMFIISAPVAFLTVFFGSSLVDTILNATPAWLLTGLNVAGGILPAIGIAVTMKIINQPKLTSVFILGYFLVQLLGLSVMGAAIIGFCVVAVLLYANSMKPQTAVMDDDDEL